MTFGRALLIYATLLCVSFCARGATITYSGTTSPATIQLAEQPTDFAGVYLHVPSFDAAQVCGPILTCALRAVTISLTGDLVLNIQFESLDAAGTTVNGNVAGNITLSRPNGSLLAVTAPEAELFTEVSAFDGTLDFEGSSGRSFYGIHQADSQSITLSDFADFMLFTGSGSIALPVAATANSFVTGPGNLICQITTLAGAEISVTYTYDAIDNDTAAMPGAPEPATLALVGGVLIVLSIVAKRFARS